jgi:hypothetical protein
MTEKELTNIMRERMATSLNHAEIYRKKLCHYSDKDLVMWHLRWVNAGEDIQVPYETAMEFCNRAHTFEQWDECL